MNKPVYLGLSISDLSKTVIYEFWYDYVTPKYGENAKLSYKDTDSFMVYSFIIFTEILQKMLKQGLSLQILNQTDHCLKEKMKDWSNER